MGRYAANGDLTTQSGLDKCHEAEWVGRLSSPFAASQRDFNAYLQLCQLRPPDSVAADFIKTE